MDAYPCPRCAHPTHPARGLVVRGIYRLGVGKTCFGCAECDRHTTTERR